MKPAYVLLAFTFWVSFVIVLTGFLENRRDRDIRRFCSQCTPSRATRPLPVVEGRPATARSSLAKVDRPNPAAFALPVEAAGTFAFPPGLGAPAANAKETSRG